MVLAYDIFDSPIGVIYVVVDEFGVRKIELDKECFEDYLKKEEGLIKDSERCGVVLTQLREYFNGKRKDFDLNLSIEGTEFRKKVWNALMDIPYGETRSYKDIAKAIGNPKGVRAVGQANRNNQIPIIIPCHRVIGKNGDLTGYAGTKIDLKKILLELEGISSK